jgi:hypothetical protein
MHHNNNDLLVTRIEHFKQAKLGGVLNPSAINLIYCATIYTKRTPPMHYYRSKRLNLLHLENEKLR